MKSRVLMAALVVVMLMGVRAYAHDCGPCSEVGPCDSCTRSCDLFSGLKRLVACAPCAPSECGPCDAIVACTPCDEAMCDPCGACNDYGCNDGCNGRKFVFGSRLKAFFAAKVCNPCDVACNPCDVVCNPCDADCGPCDADCGPCDDICSPKRKFTFPNLFKVFGKLRSSCDTDCGPCDSVCDPCGACDTSCNPCDSACDPCGACDSACDPCDSACNGGKKFGRLFDRPRNGLKKLFSFRFGNACDPCGPCEPCNPCDVACNPCDVACNPCDGSCRGRRFYENGDAAPAYQLPEAAK